MNFPFIVFAWAASILYGLETVAGKLTGKYAATNPWLLNFFWLLVVLILTLPVALFFGAGLPVGWVNILLAAFFYALQAIFFFVALAKIDISVFSPLNSFYPVIGVILGVIMLHESVTYFQYFLIAVICVFGVLVSLDEKFSLRSFFNLGIVYILGHLIFLALNAVCINKAVAESGFWTTTLWMMVIGQAILLLTIPLFIKDLRATTNKQWGAIFLAGLISTFATLAAQKAYAGNVSLSSAIISLPLSMVIAFLFSLFAPEYLEKHTLKVYLMRFAAAAIMLIAALRLT